MELNTEQTIVDDLKHAAQLDGHRLVGVLEGRLRLFRGLPESLDPLLPRPLLPRLLWRQKSSRSETSSGRHLRNKTEIEPVTTLWALMAICCIVLPGRDPDLRRFRVCSFSSHIVYLRKVYMGC